MEQQALADPTAAPAFAVKTPPEAAAGEAHNDDTKALLRAIAPKAATSDPAAGGTTTTGPAADDKAPTKTTIALAAKPPLAHNSVTAPGAPAEKGKTDADAKRTAEQPEPSRRKRQKLNDEQGQQFIALTREHLMSGMSEEYQKLRKRAAKLTPTERTALLTEVSIMIGEDQAKSLRLLDHAITVTEHFARKASE